MAGVGLWDDPFERIAALLPGKLSDSGRTAADNRRFPGSGVVDCARGVGGAIILSRLALGTASINDSPAGHVVVSGIRFLRNWHRTRILRKCSLTAQ